MLKFILIKSTIFRKDRSRFLDPGPSPKVNYKYSILLPITRYNLDLLKVDHKKLKLK